MERRLPSLDVRPFPREISCDVAVVGAGISGALIAETLTEAGLDVVILDRRDPTSGSTAASTALLQYELDVPLSRMIQRIGRDRAIRIWRRSRLAVDALRERTERLGLKVGAATRPSLYLEGNLLDPAALAAEADARSEAGFEVELIGPTEVERRYDIRRRHAITGFGNYSADPRQMAAAYLRTAQSRGARIYSPAEVTAVHPGADRVTLEIGHKQEVQASTAIFATGYEMLKGVPRKGNDIMSTWVIATKPQPRNIWKDAALIWEASDPYLYIRTTPDGAVICGGEDELQREQPHHHRRFCSAVARIGLTDFQEELEPLADLGRIVAAASAEALLDRPAGHVEPSAPDARRDLLPARRPDLLLARLDLRHAIAFGEQLLIHLPIGAFGR